MIATYFIFRGTKSAKRAENPCPPRKYLASTAIYRLYTFCCQFARAFFRISDKKFFRFKSSSPPLPPSVFSTAEMKFFHEKLSQLHKLQEWRGKRAVCCSSADSLFRQIKRFKCPPLCFGHSQRKYYFKFRDIGTPAGVPISHFHGRGRRGRRHLQRRFLRKRGAAEKASTSLQQAEPSQARERERTERVCRPLWGSWQSRQALTERASLLTKKAAAARILHTQKEPLHMVPCSGSFFMIAYFRLNFSGSKSGSSQKRVMISV